MLITRIPRFWWELDMGELYRHQEQVAFLLAQSEQLKDKTFLATIYLDISIAIVAKHLGLPISEVCE